MRRAEIGEAVSRLLFRAGAVQVSAGRPFILAGGWASPVYVDCRVLVGEPGTRRALVDLAARAASELRPASPFDAIAGGETAGIPFAAWLADRLDAKLRYVRKRPLGIGRNAQVEGGTVDGLQVLLVDDLTTDGQSKVRFARGLRDAGAVVEHVLTIFYHDAFPGAEERLRDAGLALHALATWEDVLNADRGEHLNAEDRGLVQTFLADTAAWSARHGGRSQMASR